MRAYGGGGGGWGGGLVGGRKGCESRMRGSIE